MQVNLDALKWWFMKHLMILNTEKTCDINFNLRGEAKFELLYYLNA